MKRDVGAVLEHERVATMPEEMAATMRDAGATTYCATNLHDRQPFVTALLSIRLCLISVPLN
jgi:hypothetical protein